MAVPLMAALLGGAVAWNILTDWVWIGNSLNILPGEAQKDIQKRALNIINLMDSAKSIVYSAQRDKRALSTTERELLKRNADLAEQEIANLEAVYANKFVLFGRGDVLSDMKRTTQNLRLQLENFRQVAGISKGVVPKDTKITGMVVSVHDGDTITLPNGEIIRLVGIDAPESTTEAGQASRRFLNSLILGKTVTVESDPANMTDMYGRRLGVVWLGQTNINLEMIRQGYADFYQFEPNSLVFAKVWKAAAEEAKELRIKNPLADLKAMYDDQKARLRLWKSDARAEAKATIDAEIEKLRSEQADKLDEIKEEYARTKEQLKADYDAKKEEINDHYRAKIITRDEKYRLLAELREQYRQVKYEASQAYREAKKDIRDPHTAEKTQLKALLREKYKKIEEEYRAKYTELRNNYNTNVKSIKERRGITAPVEVSLPPTVAPDVPVPTPLSPYPIPEAPPLPEEVKKPAEPIPVTAPPPTPAIPGEYPYETWQRITGLPWAKAKEMGLTDGSADKNLALQKKLLEGWRPTMPAPVVVVPPPTPIVTPPVTKQYAKVMPAGTFWMYSPEKGGWTANIPATDLGMLYRGQLPYSTVTMEEFFKWKIVA